MGQLGSDDILSPSSIKKANIRVHKVNETQSEGTVCYDSTYIVTLLNDWVVTAGFKYWLIEHAEGDDGETPHFHIVIEFKQATPWKQIKSKFPYGDIESTRDLNNSIQYLIHMNDSSKVQYKPEAIITNCGDIKPYLIPNKRNSAALVDKYLIDIECGVINEYNQYEKIPIGIWSDNRTKISNAITYAREKRCMDKNRSVIVMMMAGPTGLGKTLFAKRWCDGNKYSVCISSSSNDPLQDYKGEDVLIMDDMRDDSFKFHDFLKFTDNNTNSSVKSRYHNKVFIGHTIIITTAKPLTSWYFKRTSEDKHQLYRRIKIYMKFEGDKIYSYEYNEELRRYESVGIAPNIIALEPRARKEIIMKVFDSIGVELSPTNREALEEELEDMPGEMFVQNYVQ